jgi:hypothetical protein
VQVLQRVRPSGAHAGCIVDAAAALIAGQAGVRDVGCVTRHKLPCSYPASQVAIIRGMTAAAARWCLPLLKARASATPTPRPPTWLVRRPAHRLVGLGWGASSSQIMRQLKPRVVAMRAQALPAGRMCWEFETRSIKTVEFSSLICKAPQDGCDTRLYLEIPQLSP